VSVSPAPRLQVGASLRAARGPTVVIRGWRGEGSFARVYRGEYSQPARPCALKLAKAEIPEAGLRLEREREVLDGLRHPHVVELLDHGQADPWSIPFLVLEWLDGETLLDSVAARRRLPLRQALEWLDGICQGIGYLHHRGVAHGDLRPQNVLCVAGRGAILTDPGAGPEEAPSPEGDVRAAGRLLHYMLTGEDPAGTTSRLTPAAGHNRGVVQLWESTRATPPPASPVLLVSVRRLRASL
jgi:serine/threonine protein kinase